MGKIREKEYKERRIKINESKYNSDNGKMMVQRRPEYLKRERKWKNIRLIARFRCGNELRCGHFWRKERDRTWRIGKRGKETISHVLKECRLKRDNGELGEFLSEKGSALRRMKKIVPEEKKIEEEKKHKI